MLVHVDAAQAVGPRADRLRRRSGADLLSVSGHKIGGPPGTGALLVRRGLRLAPLLVGGDQERARRAGLENVPALVGLGAACQALADDDRLAAEAGRGPAPDRPGARPRSPTLDGVRVYGDPVDRLPHLVCLGIDGIEPQAVLLGPRPGRHRRPLGQRLRVRGARALAGARGDGRRRPPVAAHLGRLVHHRRRHRRACSTPSPPVIGPPAGPRGWQSVSRPADLAVLADRGSCPTGSRRASPGSPSPTSTRYLRCNVWLVDGRDRDLVVDGAWGWRRCGRCAGSSHTGFDFGVQNNDAMLSGTVYNDQNGDGSEDGSDAGLAGWTVFLDANGNGALDAGETTTLTDAQGHYSFEVQPGNDYLVYVAPQAGWGETQPGSDWSWHYYANQVAAGSSHTGFDFGVEHNDAVLSGTVYKDQNGDGSEDGSDAGLAGWTVFLDANGNGALDAGETTTLTDSQGHYSFEVQPGNDYLVYVDPQDGWNETQPGSDWSWHYYSNQVAAGSSHTGFDFGVFQIVADDDRTPVEQEPRESWRFPDVHRNGEGPVGHHDAERIGAVLCRRKSDRDAGRARQWVCHERGDRDPDGRQPRRHGCVHRLHPGVRHQLGHASPGAKRSTMRSGRRRDW